MTPSWFEMKHLMRRTIFFLFFIFFLYVIFYNWPIKNLQTDTKQKENTQYDQTPDNGLKVRQ